MMTRCTVDAMRGLSSHFDGLALASRGMSALRPVKKIVTIPKKILKREKVSDIESSGETSSSGMNDSAVDMTEKETPPSSEIEYPITGWDETDATLAEEAENGIPASQRIDEAKENGFPNRSHDTITTTSGYGSETSVDSELEVKNNFIQKNVTTGVDGSHCIRCHKAFEPSSKSTAHQRCLLPHPTKNVIPIRRDSYGTDFVCLCCRTEFRLPKMTFYEAGVNSMLTGFCFTGQHTVDESDIDYQQDGGAALSCEEAGCIEYFV